jgi:putative transposase
MKSLKMKIRNLSKKNFKRLKELCHHAKNLYNQALYTLNEEFKVSGKYLGYNNLDKIMQKKENLEGKINYKMLKAGVSQQILRKLDKNYISFFSLIKKYKANKSAFKIKSGLMKRNAKSWSKRLEK